MVPTSDFKESPPRRPRLLHCSGPTPEWHLVLGKSFEDITFDFVSWFHQSVVRFGSSFFPARFKAVGPITNLVGSDRVKNLLVEVPAESRVTFTLKCNQRLEGIQCLDHTFEADRSRFPIVFTGRLGDENPAILRLAETDVSGIASAPVLIPDQNKTSLALLAGDELSLGAIFAVEVIFSYVI